MQRASGSSERTPLVQPTYAFESSLARRYQKRLRSFQCAICVSIIGILAIALLVTVSYNLSNPGVPPASETSPAPQPGSYTDTTPPPATPATPPAPRNLTLLSPRYQPQMAPMAVKLPSSQLADDLAPLMKLQWPLKGKPPTPWTGDPPSAAAVAAAVDRGRLALAQRQLLESQRKPLSSSEPAYRAQRAAATAAGVKPMADAAYAAEMATRALVNESSLPTGPGSVGQGPALNNSLYPLRYCLAAPPPCPAARHRALDGSCNNLQNPLRWGVSNTPFRRLLPPVYGDSISAPRTSASGSILPSARDVSVTVHRPSYAHDTAFTVMLAVWGQFVDHDITATALSKGENSSSLSCCDGSLAAHPECFPVPLAAQDPFYQRYNLTCMEFVRSASAPTCHFGPREQMNQATAFIDASTVYGFSEARANRLRTFSGGRLRALIVGGRELLPPSVDPNDGCNTAEMAAKGRYCFESGDDRANENLHLTTMHLLWARQHNRVAGILQELNPSWTDEALYHEARRIVGAQMQHITYNEFLPNVLGKDVMWALNLTLLPSGFSSSYDPDVDPSIANHFSAAAFRFAHTLLPGLIHSADLSSGSVSYIQLHQMLFNPYLLYNYNGSQEAVSSAMITPIHGVDPHVTSELSEHLFEKPVPLNSTAPHPCGLDLVSLNIQRGRDHGLPPYPAWRELCGYSRPESFEDLRGVFDDASFERISKIYASVDDMDLYTGALAEDPGGRLLGGTLTCLVADQFLRLKIADRFWYETDDEEVGFTAEQLAELRKTTLAGIICANEGMLSRAQPRVMEAIAADNPLVDCSDLPQPDFTPWTDASGKKEDFTPGGASGKKKKDYTPGSSGKKDNTPGSSGKKDHTPGSGGKKDFTPRGGGGKKKTTNNVMLMAVDNVEFEYSRN